MRSGLRASVLGVALATALVAGGVAAGSAADAPVAAPAALPEPPRAEYHSVELTFPMRVRPRYGDGLDAGRGHEGQDLFAPPGTPLVAASDATVLETGDSGGRGNYISIYDRATNQTYNYFHMRAPALARAGQQVSLGQKLGELGCTGDCWGYHLHFEVRAGRSPYGPVRNPTSFLRRLPQP